MPPVSQSETMQRAALGLGALAIAGAILIAGVGLLLLRQEAVDQATRAADNYALVLEAHVRRTARAADLVLRRVVDMAAMHPDWHTAGDQGIAERLAEAGGDLNLVTEIALLDDAGQLRNATADAARLGEDFSDQPLFAIHRDWPDVGLFIARPATDSEGRWFIALSRRLNDSDGAFVGVAVVTLTFDQFADFLRSFDVGEHGMLTLWRDDGVVLADSRGGRAVRDPPPVGQLATRRVGNGRSTTPIDGHDQLMSHRSLPDLSLVVSASLSADEYLAGWRRAAGVYAGLAGTVLMMTGLLMIVLLRQVRHRVASQALLQDQENRLRLLADNASDMISVHAADGCYLSATRASERLLGIAPTEMAGRYPWIGVHVDDEAAVMQAFQDIRDGRAGRTVTYRVGRDDGAWTWLESRLNGIRGDDAGAPCEIVAVSRDVTERLRYQDALYAGKRRLAETARQLEVARRDAVHARYRAEEANRAKSRFLALMSHELRTPLNAILGFAEVIHKQMLGLDAIDRYRDYANDIHHAGSLLLELINDILDISKIEAGKLQPCFEPVDVAGLLVTSVRLVRESAAGKGLSVALGTVEPLPPVQADRRALQQIVFNLLSNALKCTPPGGRVMVAARPHGSDHFEITVADTGVGIPADRIGHVLEPFEGLNNQYHREVHSTGLGLAVVKALAELHEGRVEIDSQVGAGTTVHVVLPLAPGERIVRIAAA